MKKLILFAINLLLFSNLSFSQIKLDYDNDSKWFWGFNYGATWQTTDVDYKLNHGWGLTLGKSFNYNYGKVISFDIRGRYLHGTWYGQNTDTNGFSSNYQGIYNNIGSNYKDSLGYTIYNSKSNVNRLALELVIHANRIRETTGWDPYIFGGVGLTWYETKSNLIDNASFDLNPIYKYDSTGNYNVTSASALLDSDYETSVSSYKPAFMPSLGFGIGYQVGKRVSIGIEHKTTFTQRDEFDGVIALSKYKQDIYHYTSAYIRFQLKGGNSKHEQQQTNQNTTTDRTDPTITNSTIPQPPIVTFFNPNITGTVVNSANFSITAEIKYINSRDQIEFKQENTINNNFSFNPQNHQLTSNVVLLPGQNTFEIKGTNKDGVDIKNTIIIYRKDAGNPPIVTITNPVSNPTTVTNPVFNFASNVLNVESKDQIKVTFNGQNFSGFTYNTTTHNVNAVLNLVQGSNTVTVIGTNTFGQDSKTTTIIFEKPATILPPVVTITNPNINPTNVSNPAFNLSATILNVSTKNQINVKVNGTENINFTFNPTTHGINLPLTLNEGPNNIQITGTNTVGTDSKSTVIIYKRTQDIQPPVVTYVTPSTDPYTSNTPNYQVTATVTNVTSNSNIKVTLNGSNISNFDFNLSSHLVSFSANLVEGSNIVNIKGTNNAGSDEENQTIIYSKPATIAPPIVTYINPSSSPITVSNPIFTINASVLNVNGAQNIEVKINGVGTTNFNYNSVSKIVSFNVPLLLGANIFDVKGTNTAGIDSKTTTIIYRKEDVKLPPVVNITNPSSNPLSTYQATQAITASVLNVDSQQNIKVLLNGNNVTNFTYNSSSKIVDFIANLIEGNNTVSISATNSVGQASDNTAIIYKKENPCSKPTVKAIQPSTSTYISENSTVDLSALTTEISNKAEINVTLNGNNIRFNFEANTITTTAQLSPGNNAIKIVVTNPCGNASINWRVSYNPCIKPTITLVNSNIQNGQNTSMTDLIQTLKTTGVTKKEELSITNNNVQIPFLFDIQNQKIEFTSHLSMGQNKIVVSAENSCESETYNFQISRRPIEYIDTPKIKMNFPSVFPYLAQLGTTNVSGEVRNISDVNNVQIKINGQQIPNINATIVNYVLTFSFPLNVTSNQTDYWIEISASNVTGSDYQKYLITTNSQTRGEKGTVTPNQKPIGNTGVVSPPKPKETKTTITPSTKPINGRGGN